MNKVIPKKLQPGDTIRIIAPSRSLAILSSETKNNANNSLQKLGLNLSFSAHCSERDDFDSTSIEHRLIDIHEAFADPETAGILTVIGGFNSNQLLRYIDWELIRANPKVFCGYSDITALNNAIFAKTGLLNYSGPHYSTFGQKHLHQYTIEYFKKCLFSAQSFSVQASEYWSDYAWWLDQSHDERLPNNRWIVLNEGKAEGTLLGANLCTFNVLQGTEYLPPLQGSILFLEDDELTSPYTFDRDLQSLIHQPGFEGVLGLVIGRFQKASKMELSLLSQIIESKKELYKIPVIANIDFGHTEPKLTLPIGGTVKISAVGQEANIEIVQH